LRLAFSHEHIVLDGTDMAMGENLATGRQPNDDGLAPASAFIAQHRDLSLPRKLA
jgi:hypothetical protein